MTSRHDDMTFCNMSVKCSNDLPVWWNLWFTFRLIFLCSIEPEIALHVIMTSWRHVMTSRHDDMTFCNMSVKCSNDLPVWWNPWFTFRLIFLCSIDPEIALHVIMTSWRHVVTSSMYGNILYKVPYKLTCVVEPLNQSWYCVTMWNDTGMWLDISLHVRMSSSWHHDMTAWRHGLMVTSYEVPQWRIYVDEPRNRITDRVSIASINKSSIYRLDIKKHIAYPKG